MRSDVVVEVLVPGERRGDFGDGEFAAESAPEFDTRCVIGAFDTAVEFRAPWREDEEREFVVLAGSFELGHELGAAMCSFTAERESGWHESQYSDDQSSESKHGCECGCEHPFQQADFRFVNFRPVLQAQLFDVPFKPYNILAGLHAQLFYVLAGLQAHVFDILFGLNAQLFYAPFKPHDVLSGLQAQGLNLRLKPRNALSGLLPQGINVRLKPRNVLFGLLPKGLDIRLNRCYISPDRYNILPGGHIDSVVPERKNLPLDEKLSLPFGKGTISAQELYQAVRVICECCTHGLFICEFQIHGMNYKAFHSAWYIIQCRTAIVAQWRDAPAGVTSERSLRFVLCVPDPDPAYRCC